MVCVVKMEKRPRRDSGVSILTNQFVNKSQRINS